jgi:glycosyltransferase involved in cell wall biosynthesis
MRIAVVSPHLPTRALPMRGVSRDEQLRLFAAAGHEVQGVVPVPWSPRRWITRTPVPGEERDGDVVVAHPHYPWLPAALRGARLERELFCRAAAAAIAPAPDVVLAHSVSLPGGLRTRIGRAVFVVALHDHELYDLAPHSAVLRDAIVQALRRADCAVYVSEALRRQGVALAGPHRATVIPIGIESHPELSVEPPQTFTICTVTRLIARKRVDQLIRVFARLGATRPARLVIVGDGPERPALAQLVRSLNLEASVEMTGALDARAAQERMARASVMALPSARESLGAVYLEAMSLGVPALGTRGEGIEPHIEDGVSGILVPPGDDDALLAALSALADDPARARRIGDEGRRRFLAGRYSWQANADAYLSLFEELLRARATQTT